MHVSLFELARGVDATAALEWWSDYQDGRHDHRFVPRHERRVERHPSGAATLHDEIRALGVTLFRETLRVERDKDGVAFSGSNPLATFAGRYAFWPAPEGTQVRLEVDLALAPRLRYAGTLAPLAARAILAADLKAHVREMRRDLGKAPHA